jgi:hypothetical protein
VVKDYEETLKTEPKPRPGRPSSGLPAEVRKFDTAVGTILRFDIESLRDGITADLRARLQERVREAATKLETAKSLL